jgi:ribosomal protein L30E
VNRRFLPVVLVASLAALLVGSVAFGSETAKPAKPAKSAMHHYLVMASHTPEECLKALDDYAAESKALSTFEFGCKSGDHTGYAIVAASSEDAARNMCPASARANAKIVELNKFTAADIKKIHEQMAHQ